jgi:ABC-type Fe3+-hydroxamate transport system substrate-binding protein
MPFFTDQLSRIIELPVAPQRIVSIVPSQTELLYSLGLNDQVVGITKFCVHPESWFRQKTRIGGTKALHMDRIHQLQPDLIIANKEENVKEQVEELARHYPVWISNINNLPDALDMIGKIGAVTDTAAKAAGIIENVTFAFKQLQTIPAPQQPGNYQLQTAYLIWKNPYMTIGSDTFIHDMLTRCGFQNIFAHTTRYPAITIEQLQAAGCQLLLLSSEPYPFKQQHIDELQQHLPHTTIRLVDGEMFSWYGSRLLHAPAYFTRLIQQVN